MHKVLLGVASTGLMLAALPAQALEPDVNLSGTFALSLSYFNNDNNLGRFSDTELENNASNFRLTAAAQEVGIRAFVAYERGASNDQPGVEDVREFFGGLSGKYGTLLYGRKGTDYKLSGERLDPFYNTSVAGYNGQFANTINDNLPTAEGASYGLSNLTNGFTSNTISYRSPALYGFGANAALYVNDNDTTTNDDGDFGLGLSYANSAWFGLDVGVQALSINGNVVTNAQFGSDAEAYRLHGSIGEKLWAVGASFEVLDVEAERDARNYAFVSGSYQFLRDLRLAIAFGNVSNTGTTPQALPSANFDGNGVTFGTFYDLTKNLSSYAAVRYVTLDDNNEDETTTIATGIKFVFDVDL